ncbi:lytic transglycosylase domain-containing protein [Roseomonas sp. OT10]|uniref:lytic transglycosylase domain-containing protein n=1 Tax=Roseomonas cutis TaxID=2897332 RepID=UPI001E2DF341|nr:lytic transglycosylase domain-containing protein [Roseomonas sp. OT10]UFN51285.1 lytic transglycosylase domain-containing protein [Roseomonas sp. OT10]
MPRFLAVLLLAALLSPGTGRAQGASTGASADWTLCRRTIAALEPGSGVPPGLLGAIGLVESGRQDPATGRPEPWPWSYNASGTGHAAPTKAAAVAAVAALAAAGTRSVDVGCMQVNLLHHPDAFPGLEQAFDPVANIRYAIRFLLQLRARSQDWGEAIGRYHSGEAERGADYSRRVALAQLGVAWNRGGTVPLPGLAGAGLCAAGLRPALLFGGAREARRFLQPGAARAARPLPLPRTNNRPRMVCLRPGR